MEIFIRGTTNPVACISRIAAWCAILLPKSPEEGALQPGEIGNNRSTAPTIDNVVFGVVLNKRVVMLFYELIDCNLLKVTRGAYKFCLPTDIAVDARKPALLKILGRSTRARMPEGRRKEWGIDHAITYQSSNGIPNADNLDFQIIRQAQLILVFLIPR
ncbi:hypothetical protein TMatcc_002842 [Talaromyces marneffei ATCC 18224]